MGFYVKNIFVTLNQVISMELLLHFKNKAPVINIKAIFVSWIMVSELLTFNNTCILVGKTI